MKKRIIICLIGASGSGKTTASWILGKRFGWNVVVSYTTRPMRNNETNGKDHWFVNDVPDKNRMAAYTRFGDYEYWTTWHQLCLPPVSVYVIDEKGYEDLCNNTGNMFCCIAVHVKRQALDGIDEDRKSRDNDRICFPDESYDYIIDNNASLEHFKNTLHRVGKDIIKKYHI